MEVLAVSERVRAGVLLLDDDKVCLIKRVRGGFTYYLFPGGGVEDGESPEEAAVREAHEELGLEVQLIRLVGDFNHGTQRQLFYLARIMAGTFGTGSGEELSSTADLPMGTYEPTWLPLKEAVSLDTRPIELCRALLKHRTTITKLTLSV